MESQGKPTMRLTSTPPVAGEEYITIKGVTDVSDCIFGVKSFILGLQIFLSLYCNFHNLSSRTDHAAKQTVRKQSAFQYHQQCGVPLIIRH